MTDNSMEIFRFGQCSASIALIAAVLACPKLLPAQAWRIPENSMLTRWAEEVSPENPLPEYPRPQFVRKRWLNLNGLWDYAVRPRGAGQSDAWEGKILVPFAIQSALSGVKWDVAPDQALWYQRTFTLPDTWRGQRILLHFGGVDWKTNVWVNGQHVGNHRGGYGPFSLDITSALTEKATQRLTVRVWDPTDKGYQPRGKQVQKPRGIWYTAVTGIWQTVWLEPVSPAHIVRAKITPDVDDASVRVKVTCHLPAGDGKLALAVRHNGQTIQRDEQAIRSLAADDQVSAEFRLFIPSPRLWSPDDPFLYDLDLRLDAGDSRDNVSSYFGMRKIEVRRDEEGILRLFLNNEPLFHFGPLDQGWWPDGLYTAPTDDALAYDIEVTRGLGFNMCRKHVKVEPARWYYWCDRLGLMVWQDMPSGDRYIKRDEPDIVRSSSSALNFRREYQALIDTYHNHPCIVAWVPFNEGWGQFETHEILAWTKQYDPTRLVDGPSGWTDRGSGDMHDIHQYPGPDMPPLEENRAAVLGEFGGLGLPMKGHLWVEKNNWGYRTYETREDLVKAYRQLIGQLTPLIKKGLAAAIYTQTTDVEIEVNGLMTYDRAVLKLPRDISRLHRQVIAGEALEDSAP